MTQPVRLVILGSTGSIGRQALEVAARHPDRIAVVGLAAARSVDMLAEQARAHGVTDVALADESACERLARLLPGARIRAGAAGVAELATHTDADVVLNALVGAAGLRATLASLDAGKRLALANKESLVAGGRLVMERVRFTNQLIPVDSEHSALFQCLHGEHRDEVARLWLTASGGPFRGWRPEDLAGVSVDEALRHPRWSMGPKITIDSATLMNKGLEAIEAHHLFAIPYERIEVVIHPQSCIHSMVEFRDGSVKAHLGATDMRIPIQYALSFPERWDAPVEPVDFATLGRLEFERPDLDAFPCLRIALDAGRAGGSAPAVMNAANEVAVTAFLERRIGFLDIPRIVEATLEAHEPTEIPSIEHVERVDAWARAHAASLV